MKQLMSFIPIIVLVTSLFTVDGKSINGVTTSDDVVTPVQVLPSSKGRAPVRQPYRVSPNMPPNRKKISPTSTTVTTTPSTTTKEAFDDYYDYIHDQGYSVNKDKSTTTTTTARPDPRGCPGRHSVCQHYCERQNYYSGYCEGHVCRCFGKL